MNNEKKILTFEFINSHAKSFRLLKVNEPALVVTISRKLPNWKRKATSCDPAMLLIRNGIICLFSTGDLEVGEGSGVLLIGLPCCYHVALNDSPNFEPENENNSVNIFVILKTSCGVYLKLFDAVENFISLSTAFIVSHKHFQTPRMINFFFLPL